MKFWWIFFLGLITVSAVSAQSIEDLHAKKAALKKQIKQLNSLETETSQHKKKSIESLRLLELQVQTRTQLIADINNELQVINERMENNQLIVEMLQADLKLMKEEYASMIRLAQLTSNSYDALIFIISAEGASQAYSRWLYLRQYAQYRSTQLISINSVTAKVQSNLNVLSRQKIEKEALMQQKQQELQGLAEQEQKMEAVLSSLGSKQAELKEKVQKQQKAEAALGEQIEKLLAQEAKKSLAMKQDANTNFDELSAGFLAKKGLLASPIPNGVITVKFGSHKHPLLPNVQIQSNGIEITASAGVRPKAIYDGVVTKVFEVSEGNKALILRHGTYLSVYTNFSEVSVTVGSTIKEGQVLGVLSSKGGYSVLKFQIWKENTKLNPQEWLMK